MASSRVSKLQRKLEDNMTPDDIMMNILEVLLKLSSFLMWEVIIRLFIFPKLQILLMINIH